MDVPAALKDADSTREAQLLESWKAYKKGFQEGISLFNKKPKKGIAFMQVTCTADATLISLHNPSSIKSQYHYGYCSFTATCRNE